ncbi:ElyC/SanA/YdcF family protein [Photobacterium damselae]|uniref:ElyC/SanA/YdcF family protein n=1 Tax=Photobacterium damselae TaxID=38293 RepID=UPI004067E8FD
MERTLALENAFTAFKSSNRTDYQVNGQLTNNIDAAILYLKQHLEQYPNDHYAALTLGNLYTFQGRYLAAFSIWQPLSNLPKVAHNAKIMNIACFYLATWHHYKDELFESEYYSQLLHKYAPKRSQHFDLLIHTLHHCLSLPIQYNLPNSNLNNHAIIVLGHQLNPDGTLSDFAKDRLKIAIKLKKKITNSLIFLTGGRAQNGMSEAQAMKQWLQERGIDHSDIVLEEQSRNTIENAQYTVPLLHLYAIESATIISNSIHVHRALLAFSLSNNKQENSAIEWQHVAVKDGLLANNMIDEETKRNSYIDALRCLDLPAFYCPPEMISI